MARELRKSMAKEWEMILKQTVGSGIMTKYIYLTYVDRYIGAFNPYTWQIEYAPTEKFVPFVQRILNDYPEYTPHCVLDRTIEKVIRDKIIHDNLYKLAQNKNIKE